MKNYNIYYEFYNNQESIVFGYKNSYTRTYADSFKLNLAYSIININKAFKVRKNGYLNYNKLNKYIKQEYSGQLIADIINVVKNSRVKDRDNLINLLILES